ncbi:MAG TPA: hypothetical protein VFU02_02820 [Polyangiaceae bacterium]|nr:hypothetical protein [Polyangiaceae bacterium]
MTRRQYLTPPVRRFEAEPDHPRRLGLDLIRQVFPATAAQAEPRAHSLEPILSALRAHLYRRALLDRAASASDVPVLFMTAPPEDEERAALAARLAHFSAAVLVLFERHWDEPLAGENLVHLSLPRSVDGALAALLAATPGIDAKRPAFAARQAQVDQAVRELLLAPPPVVRSVTRATSKAGPSLPGIIAVQRTFAAQEHAKGLTLLVGQPVDAPRGTFALQLEHELEDLLFGG